MKLRCFCLGVIVGALTLIIPPAAGAASGNKSLIAAGQNHTIVIQKDGSLWACGDNESGVLGLGDTTDRATLTRVGTANNWTAIAHHTHALGLRADGTLWAWGGDNSQGQMGQGNTTPLHIPTKVGSDTHWVAVSVGDSHSLGLKDNGTLWAWGGNSNGQLGLGEIGNQNSPTKVGTGWVAIASGGGHSFGLKADGSLYAWGYNCYGQLGVGNTTDQHTPVPVGTGWVAVSGGFWPDYHSLGLKADGSLWAWGYNGDGQLGLGVGDSTNRSAPTQVGSDVNWVAVSAGGSYSLGLRADGTLWAWGYGGNELGLGDPDNNRFVPTKVPRFNAPRAAVIPLY